MVLPLQVFQYSSIWCDAQRGILADSGKFNIEGSVVSKG